MLVFNAPLNTQFVRLIMFYLCLPTVGPYWLRFGAQTSQSAHGKKKVSFQGSNSLRNQIVRQFPGMVEIRLIVFKVSEVFAM